MRKIRSWSERRKEREKRGKGDVMETYFSLQILKVTSELYASVSRVKRGLWSHQ